MTSKQEVIFGANNKGKTHEQCRVHAKSSRHVDRYLVGRLLEVVQALQMVDLLVLSFIVIQLGGVSIHLPTAQSPSLLSAEAGARTSTQYLVDKKENSKSKRAAHSPSVRRPQACWRVPCLQQSRCLRIISSALRQHLAGILWCERTQTQAKGSIRSTRLSTKHNAKVYNLTSRSRAPIPVTALLDICLGRLSSCYLLLRSNQSCYCLATM